MEDLVSASEQVQSSSTNQPKTHASNPAESMNAKTMPASEQNTMDKPARKPQTEFIVTSNTIFALLITTLLTTLGVFVALVGIIFAQANATEQQIESLRIEFRSEVQSLRAEMQALRSEVQAEMQALRSEVQSLERKIDDLIFYLLENGTSPAEPESTE